MLFRILALAALIAANAAAAQTSVPDLRGTWKGESETVVVGAGNTHHPATAAEEPELRSVAFTLTIDKQEGRRLSGIFSSPRGSYRVVAVVSRTGTIFLADVEGYSSATMLASDRMELCYLKHSWEARVASCTELIKQPYPIESSCPHAQGLR
jgi:hypothetical protein